MVLTTTAILGPEEGGEPATGEEILYVETLLGPP
jgi:hypothetical protein